MVRTAFTLIELIFAIVVMSIVMLSFPMIMQVDSDARERAFAQEAALAASAKMAQLLTYQWDERSLDWGDLAENIQTSARLLDDTNHSTNAFARVAGTQSRVGGGHRQFFPAVTNASALADDNNTLIGGREVVVGLDEQGLSFGPGSGFDAGFAAGSFGYKRNYQMQIAIGRVDDGSTVDYTQPNIGFVFTQGDVGGQTNLRVAEVSIRDGDTNRVLTRLYSYAANIGEYQAYSRIRP